MEPPTQKITLHTLQEFCSKLPHPQNTQKPYYNRGKICATDGRILVAIDPIAVEPIEGDMPANGPDLIPRMFPFDHETVSPEMWMAVPAVDVPTIPCKKCSGSGKYRMCTECKGDGTSYSTCSECGAERETTCQICYGKGHSDSMPEIQCPDCDGDGHLPDNLQIGLMVGCVRLSKLYLNLIHRNLPNPKIENKVSGDFYDMVRFKFDGGLGYLMPMRIV